MDENRKGEIALFLVKRRLRKEGIPLGNNAKRELGDACGVRISHDELLDFYKGIADELVIETYTKTPASTGRPGE